VVQIVTLTGSLTDTGEDGETTVGLGDVVLVMVSPILNTGHAMRPYNQLLNEHSLSDTGTSEETDLSTTSVGGQQVDNLDTSDEHLSGGGLLDELRGVGVDGGALVGLDGTTLVDGVTGDVHDATEGGRAHGNHDGCASVGGLVASDETLGTYNQCN
jgi:hypothetical protein